MSVARAVPTIRRSLAEGLATCPAFAMERSERLAFGSAFHSFAAAYWRHLQARDSESDLIAWPRLAEDAWARTPGLRQSRFDEFLGLAERFASTHLGDLATLSAVEEPITLHVGWAVLVCTPDRIDRIDGGDPDEDATWERITDYKTERGEMDHEFQLRWYIQMRFLTRPSLERIDAVLDLVRRDRPHDPIPFLRGELDSWWEATLAGLRRRLDAGPGAPVGGPACDGCALRRTCGESLAAAVAVPETNEEADKLLAEHRRLAAAAGVRWDALRNYYEDREPRVVNGEEVGYLESRDPAPVVTVSTKELVAWATGHGMDGWEFARPVMPANRGLREQLVVAGLAAPRVSVPAFKTRKALTGTRVRWAAEEEER